ncbi:ribonucleotide reductase N-terminal alpha domain-containing protein [Klebsiella pneumoniae]|uniref:ribonucleotide reductase N-terminal alpha domain-containing protein n=1 Tax=Klebsiella pneumoniae TaxID=573 RepID=UPI0039687587
MHPDLDLLCPHFSLHHIRGKYALRNRKTGQEYETAQFVYMRMAMALAEKEPAETRMTHVENYYKLLSNKILSAPTPNYVNLGTKLRGFASCCLLASDNNV